MLAPFANLYEMQADAQNQTATVFLVDDEATVRRSMRRFLKSAGYRVEAFESADAFLNRLPINGVGCLLLDIQMPEISGLELQERLVGSGFRLPIIFLTSHGDVPSSVKAMKFGAQDFLSKLEDESVLFAAVEKALESSRKSCAVVARFASLTERELDTCQHVIAGNLNKQIADSLGITERTVKAHRSQVMEKTGVDSVADLVRLAQQAGIPAAKKWG